MFSRLGAARRSAEVNIPRHADLLVGVVPVINLEWVRMRSRDVNFQRVPCVDTSNPFISRDIPLADESFLVIRFAHPKGIDFQYLLNMVHDSFMARANPIVVPGGKMELATQLIFTPFIGRMIARRQASLGRL